MYRGIYYIKVSLHLVPAEQLIQQGSQLTGKLSQYGIQIAPIGCFAAPSTFDASIAGSSNKLTCPFPLFNGNVDDIEKTFHSRTIVIRYRDEIHVNNNRCMI